MSKAKKTARLLGGFVIGGIASGAVHAVIAEAFERRCDQRGKAGK